MALPNFGQKLSIGIFVVGCFGKIPLIARVRFFHHGSLCSIGGFFSRFDGKANLIHFDMVRSVESPDRTIGFAQFAFEHFIALVGHQGKRDFLAHGAMRDACVTVVLPVGLQRPTKDVELFGFGIVLKCQANFRDR